MNVCWWIVVTVTTCIYLEPNITCYPTTCIPVNKTGPRITPSGPPGPPLFTTPWTTHPTTTVTTTVTATTYGRRRRNRGKRGGKNNGWNNTINYYLKVNILKVVLIFPFFH